LGGNGECINLNLNNVSNKPSSILNLNSSGVNNFAANATGNIISGTSTNYIMSANTTIISHALVRNIINNTLANTMEAVGQGAANVIEAKLNPTTKQP
jgi:hypothetical protein